MDSFLPNDEQQQCKSFTPECFQQYKEHEQKLINVSSLKRYNSLIIHANLWLKHCRYPRDSGWRCYHRQCCCVFFLFLFEMQFNVTGESPNIYYCLEFIFFLLCFVYPCRHCQWWIFIFCSGRRWNWKINTKIALW